MSIPAAMLDSMLDKIASVATRVTYCSGNPSSYSAISGVSLGYKTISSGSFSKANGDVSGRKLTLAAQSAITPTCSASTACTYIALDDGTTLLASNPITSQNIVNTQTWACPAVKVLEIRDPSYA